jgi:subtilase family serine protease
MPNSLMARGIVWTVLASSVCGIAARSSAADLGTAPPLIVQPVNAADTAVLRGNTRPEAAPAADQGLVEPDRQLDLMLVLQRSPEQERALAAFNERQQDPSSPDYHHWLSAEEFGAAYGPSDHDIGAVSAWLVGSGFESLRVNKGRTYIEFSGNAARVQQALKIQLHRYLVDGTEQMANDRDPQVPYALSPVVRGIVGLNDFPIHSPMHAGRYVERNLSTGTYTVLKPSVPPMDGASPAAQAPVQPDFTFDYGSLVFEFVSPYDFATIYNSLPLWNASTPIVGTGVTIAIVGDGNINPNDIATFRKSFGLPARAPKIIYTSKNPGGATSSENTLDIEMAGAAAPGANITLVVPPNGTTVGGLLTAISYIVDNETAPIMSASYGVCELKLGTSGNALVNSAWQQGATEGISIFVSAGDQGSAGCTGQGTPDSADTYGLQVNGFASSPFVTAVGGTDFVWGWRSGGESTYWNKTANTATGASAKGYIPEIPWNTTCADPVIADYYFLTSAGKPEFASPEAVCNAISSAKNRYSPLLTIGAGSGGVSDCTIPSGTTTATCAGGYAKPSWQTGIGVPADGKRDVPDVALFASYGWPDFAAFGSLTPIVPESSEILFCYSGGTNPHACSYSSYGTIVYQGNGGTSAASPYWSGIMAMVLQKHGGAKQGLANPTLYKLAGKETLSSCNTATVKSGNTCTFYDIASGTNAQPCKSGGPNCVTKTAGDAYGILSGYSATTGYDMTTGLGSVNIANLVDNWGTTAPSPFVFVSTESLSFAATAVGSASAAQTITVKNTGAVAIALTSGGITLTGTAAASFSKTTTCAASLAVGASCAISITFKPTAAGSLAAILSIADNAANSPQRVGLFGTGAATLTVSPASLTFAATALGKTSPAQSVTVKNTGKVAATIASGGITLTGSSAFTKTTTCGSSLAIGASCTISVSFKPAADGSLAATLSIGDDGIGSPQKVSLSGTGG